MEASQVMDALFDGIGWLPLWARQGYLLLGVALALWARTLWERRRP